MVIGDFPEAEAREYFDKQARPAPTRWWGAPRRPPEPCLGDDEWGRVFDVCGGNAGCLTTVAVSASGPTTPSRPAGLQPVGEVGTWLYDLIGES